MKKEREPTRKLSGVVTVHEIQQERFSLQLKGINPLLMERKSPRIIQEIQTKQEQRVNPEKGAPKDFDALYEEAHYRLENGDLCFPAVAFKQACEDAARRYTGGEIKGTVTAGGFFVEGDMVPVKYGRIERTVELVKVPPRTGKLTPLHRPLVHDWSVVITIRFNKKGPAISAERIVYLFQLAGFHIGVGRKRPGLGHGYSLGTWEVAGA